MNQVCINCFDTSSHPISLTRFVCDTCLFPVSFDYTPSVVEPMPVFETPLEALTRPQRPNVPKTMPSGIKRDCSKMRLPELFKLGIVKRYDKLSIIGKIGSDAQAISADKVACGSFELSWNSYGQQFTGHKAVNIYKHVLVNGVLLETLRREA